jgi:hypothetical protein
MYSSTAERVGGRVVKQHVGSGHAASFAALLEAATRDERTQAAEVTKSERDELDALETALAPLHALAELLRRNRGERYGVATS